MDSEASKIESQFMALVDRLYRGEISEETLYTFYSELREISTKVGLNGDELVEKLEETFTSHENESFGDDNFHDQQEHHFKPKKYTKIEIELGVKYIIKFFKFKFTCVQGIIEDDDIPGGYAPSKKASAPDCPEDSFLRSVD